jgi:hypothetical protein
MKSNARLYLPWPVVSAFVEAVAAPAAEALPKHHDAPFVSVLRLDGGCLLYRLPAENQRVRGAGAPNGL